MPVFAQAVKYLVQRTVQKPGDSLLVELSVSKGSSEVERLHLRSCCFSSSHYVCFISAIVDIHHSFFFFLISQSNLLNFSA